MTTRVTLGSSAPLVPTTEFSIAGTVSAGDAVYQVSGADNTVAQADASDAGKRPPIGIVESVSGSTCVVALNGEVATSLSGLTRGTVYWLGTVAGQLVSSKPATNAHPLGIAVSATALRIDTVAYGINIAGGSGTVTSAGITSADLTVSNSPITTSGVIDLALNTVPVSKGGTGLTSATEQGASLIASSSSAYVAQASSLSWRNRVINGDMRVAQRGTAAVTASNAYPVDRFYTGYLGTGTFSAQQSATAPTGFSNSMLWTTTATGTNTATNAVNFNQKIEGYSIFDLGWGSPEAKTVTLSFWVKASVAGTYNLSIVNYDYTYSYVAPYTVSAINTWEQKVITIAGPTVGIWNANNDFGIQVRWDLGSGTNYSTTANTWTSGNYARTTNQVIMRLTSGSNWSVTGVQLEVGSVATPFEVLPYEKQLELCQRYFARLSSLSGNFVGFGAGCSQTTANAIVYVKYPQQMRSAPTITQSNCAIFNTAARAIAAMGTTNYGSDSLMINIGTAAATQTVGQGVMLTGNNNASAYIDLNAEL
jgi:hypothetical protein